VSDEGGRLQRVPYAGNGLQVVPHDAEKLQGLPRAGSKGHMSMFSMCRIIFISGLDSQDSDK
jgi:hypothetical protein